MTTTQQPIVMNTMKLPNTTTIYLLGLLSCFIFCFGGIGIIPAVISYYLTTKSEAIYRNKPDAYSNYSMLRKGKIIVIIGIVLNLIIVAITIWTLLTIGWEAWSEEFVRKWNQGLESGRGY